MNNLFTDDYPRNKVAAFHINGIEGHVVIACIDEYGFHERNLFVDSLKRTSGYKTYEFSEYLPDESDGFDCLIYCLRDFNQFEHMDKLISLYGEESGKKLIVWDLEFGLNSMPQWALEKTDWLIIRELERKFLADSPLSIKREEWRSTTDNHLRSYESQEGVLTEGERLFEEV